MGARLYRLLLLLYPPGFRRRFGQELLEGFERDLSRPRFAGMGGALRFWALTLADLARTVPVEWLSTLRITGAPAARRDGLSFWGDLRYAARSLRKAPTFTTVSLLTLTLGLGATTAIFTVVHSVLLRPLALPESERLVRVYERQRNNADARMVAYGNYADLRASGAFESLAIWAFGSQVLTGVDRAAQLRTREVSANFASTLGVRPLLGRWIVPEEESLGEHVVVLSHELWRSTFGGDSALVGRAVTLDGEPYTVVGVMPPEFDYPSAADGWVPLAPVTNPQGLRRWHRHNMVGRMAPGLTPEELNRRIAPFAERLAQTWPETNADDYFEAVGLTDSVVRQVRPALRILFGAVLVLLLIATVNLTSLVYARAGTREREIAVRTALGASASRVRRLVVAESLLLAALGGALGLWVASAGTRALVAMSAGAIPRADEIGLSLPVVAFTLVVSGLTGLLLAGITMWRFGSRDRAEGVAQVLHGGRSSSGLRAVRNRRVLVTAELALALVLTVGAGLLVRSFEALVSVEPGVDAERLLALDLRLPGGSRYATPADVARFLEGMLPDVEAVPGVTRAAAMLTEPVDNSGWFNTLTIRNRPVVPEPERPWIGYNVVSSGYFETVGLRLLEGRTFRPDEPLGGHMVGVLNRAAAELHWPGESPVGALILGNLEGDSSWVEVIGVVENVRQSLTEPAHPEVYVPLAQDRVLSFVVLARTPGPPAGVARPVEAVIRRADAEIPVADVGPFAGRIGDLVARPRFSATLMGSFAGLALVLACVGVYGLLALSVSERRKQIGIRMALGAGRTRVLTNVLREAATMCAIAIAIGLAGALAATRLLGSLLFGVTPTDPAALAAAVASLALVSAGAAFLPARSATAVDPASVLREE